MLNERILYFGIGAAVSSINISRESVMEYFDPSVLMEFVSRVLLGFWRSNECFCAAVGGDFYVIGGADYQVQIGISAESK